MPSMTNLLVFDDEATPVEHTFEPINDNPDVCLWRTSDTSVADEAQKRFYVSQVKLKNGQWKTSAKLEVPVMEVPVAAGASGYMAAPKVAHTTTTILTQFSNRRATSQDRANALRLLIGLTVAAGTTSASAASAVNTATQTFVSSTKAVLRAFVALVRPS